MISSSASIRICAFGGDQYPVFVRAELIVVPEYPVFVRAELNTAIQIVVPEYPVSEVNFGSGRE